MTSALFAAALVLALCVHLYRLASRDRARARSRMDAELASIAAVVADARDMSTGTVGVATWAGTWNGERVQVRTIVDTLATRKLPALWLSVTIVEKVAVQAVIDLMMRPGSATTFSNFDHLPHTVGTPKTFPEEAVIRTDTPGLPLPLDVVAAHLGIFADGRAKELLVTPNGVRIVWLLAEADRARYGVFRQAEFGGATLDPRLIEDLLRRASALRRALNGNLLQAAA